MARPKGSKNKPKATLEKIFVEEKVSKPRGPNETVYLIMERSTKSSIPTLFTYTENEESAKSLIRYMENLNNKKSYSIVKEVNNTGGIKPYTGSNSWIPTKR